MEWFIVLLYTLLCTLHVFIGRKSEASVVKLASKCAPLMLLSGVVAKQIFVGEQLSAVIATSPESSDAAGDLYKLFGGLVFGFIGDAYLVFEGTAFFIMGLISFAVGHLFYTVLFANGSFLQLQPVDAPEIVAGIAIALVTTGIFLYILPKLSKTLVVAAIAYCILISMMVWSAFLQFHRGPVGGSCVGLLGAVTFYVSDVILSVNKWRFRMPFGDTLIMVTYYTGQVLIAWSVLAK